MDNVEVLKEEWNPPAWCVVAWFGEWPQSKVSYKNLSKNTLEAQMWTKTTLDGVLWKTEERQY